jgi:hypothetical protein
MEFFVVTLGNPIHVLARKKMPAINLWIIELFIVYITGMTMPLN